MSRVCLYYRTSLGDDRWLPGDRYVRPLVRRLVRGRQRPGGIDRVFLNLRAGLDRLGVRYEVNLPFRRLTSDDRVGVLGRGRRSLEGYDRPNPILAGIGLMTHPAEWPSLCADYPVTRYLQHSEWTAAIYRPYYGDRVAVWPVGIDTDRWAPPPRGTPRTEVLVYDKIQWDRERLAPALLDSVRRVLEARGLPYRMVRYGQYDEVEYRAALARARALVFLSPHESQGLAYQEAMSADVPILAWDPGWWTDPNRARWGEGEVRATSVPNFDERCGVRFVDATAFTEALDELLHRQAAGELRPRDFVLEQLTLERGAERFLDHLTAAAASAPRARTALAEAAS